jgi:5-methylcytosine-specific restriction endonuclease McrA
MPFGRLHEEAAGDSKLLALTNAAWRMWGMGLIYCQKNLTDGFISESAIDTWAIREQKGQRLRDVAKELCTPQVPGKSALWEKVDGGYLVHDYLQWNDSKAQILAMREIGKTRRQLYSDVELLTAVRERDGSACRYCGRPVNWRDRRGPGGATYDHVDPTGCNSLENLVIACRGCNSSKGPRSLAECGMRLLPAPNPDPTYVPSNSESKSVLEIEHARASGRGTWSVDQQEENVSAASSPPRRGSGGVFAGALPREHTTHAACDETFARCVPSAVHAKLVNLLSPKHRGDRGAAGEALHAWYPTVWASLPADFVMGDAFKFWQGKFDARFASQEVGATGNTRRSGVPNADETRDQQRRLKQVES